MEEKRKAQVGDVFVHGFLFDSQSRWVCLVTDVICGAELERKRNENEQVFPLGVLVLDAEFGHRQNIGQHYYVENWLEEDIYVGDGYKVIS